MCGANVFNMLLGNGVAQKERANIRKHPPAIFEERSFFRKF